MLTKEEIRYLLAELAQETVVEPSSGFPYRVTCRKMGYSDDLQRSKLQAKLSIMLEAASR